MVDPDIQTAIDIIDKKIDSLQQARNQLALAFGLVDQNRDKAQKQMSAEIPAIRPRQLTRPPAQTSVAPLKPRKEALAEFLIENGPMSRADIVNNAGLPEGTVSYCLADKRFFEQQTNGDWTATEFSKRGFQMKAHDSSVRAN